MRKAYRVILLVIAVLMAFAIVPAMAVGAADLPDSAPSVITMKCYRNLLETADFLIVWEACIPYAVTPDDPVTQTYIWELIDTDGVTVLGSTVGYAYVDDGYNYQCFSMYFDAAAALTWDPAPSYTLKLSGNPIQFASPPEYNFTVTSGDYSSMVDTDDVQAELAYDILLIATDLDLRWGLATSLIYDDETGQTLSTFGQAYFRGCIYGLQALAPGLFPLAVTTIELADRTWTDSYVTTLENQWAGTWIETAREGGKALFSTSVDLLTIIILLIGLVALFIGETILTNNYWSAAIDVAFVSVITAKLSFYSLGYLGLACAISIIYLGMRLFKFPH